MVNNILLSTLINNRWQAGEAEVFQSSTPDARLVLWQKNASSTAQVIQAVDAAQAAKTAWASRELSERIAIIEAFSAQLKTQQMAFAKAIALETGKPLWEALGEVTAMINKVAISIRAQAERAGLKQHNHLSLTHRAHGVMAVFGPFNFPGHLPNGHIVPALLAGNTVVFKPSELTPWVAELTAAAWLEAGLPEGVLNLVQGGREVGEALVDANVDGILFTGSNATGKAIHCRLAGRPEVLLALEMGGNNPLIVGDFHDTEIAANTILHSAFLSAGQRCTCARRLIVVENHYSDILISALKRLCERVIINTVEVSQLETLEAFMGPVINATAAQQLLAAQQALVDEGAAVILPMSADTAGSVYLSPGIIDVTDARTVPDRELFGPLLQVTRVKNFATAMDCANNTRFGLAAGLISDEVNEQEQFRRGIRAGVISINLPTAGASSELPFGGIGASGNHRPSAYYAADYCAWPQALSAGSDTAVQIESYDGNRIRGLK